MIMGGRVGYEAPIEQMKPELLNSLRIELGGLKTFQDGFIMIVNPRVLISFSR